MISKNNPNIRLFFLWPYRALIWRLVSKPTERGSNPKIPWSKLPIIKTYISLSHSGSFWLSYLIREIDRMNSIKINPVYKVQCKMKLELVNKW